MRGRGPGSLNPAPARSYVHARVHFATAGWITAHAGDQSPQPESKTTAGELKVDSKPLSVAIDDKGDVFVADQSVPMDGVLGKLQELAKDGYDERIYLRGAKDVNYGRVAEVMTLITSAGYKKVALVTEQSAK